MANITQKLTLQIRGQDDTQKAFRGVDGRMKQLQTEGQKTGGAINAAFRAASAGVAVLAAKVGFDLLKSMQMAGEQARQVSESFQRAFGPNSVDALEAFGQAARGAIDQTTLQGMTNGLRLVGFSVQEIASVTDTALRLSITRGRDATDVFKQLSQAIATGEAESLKSLGIIVDQAAAQEMYARSIGKTVGELTRLEKNQAALAAVTEKVGTSFAGGIDTAAAIRANQRLRTELANMWSDMTENAAAVGDALAQPLILALESFRGAAAWIRGSGEEVLRGAQKVVAEQAALTDADTFRQFDQYAAAIKEMERLVSHGLTPSISNFRKQTQQDLLAMEGDFHNTVQVVGAIEEKMRELGLVTKKERTETLRQLSQQLTAIRSTVLAEQARAEAEAKAQKELEATLTFRSKAAAQEAQALEKWWSTRENIAKLEKLAENERTSATAARLVALRLQLQLQEEENTAVRGLEAEFQRLAKTSENVPDPKKVEVYNGAIQRSIDLVAGLREQLIANGLQMGTLNELEAAQMRFEMRRQQILASSANIVEKSIQIATEAAKLEAERARIQTQAADAERQALEQQQARARANAQQRRMEAEQRAQRLQALRDREADLALSIQTETGLLSEQELLYAQHLEALHRLDREGVSDREYAVRERILADEYQLAELKRLNQERIEEERRQQERNREIERQALEERREAARRQMELDRAIAAQRRENALQAAAALQIAAQGINAQVGAMAAAFVQAQAAQEGYAEAEKQGAAAAQAAAPGLISAYGAVAGSVITNVKVMSIVRGLFETAAAIASAAVGDLRGAALHGAASAAFFVAAGQTKSQGKSLAASTATAAGSAQVASQAAQPAQSQNITINYQESGFRVGTMQELGAGVARVLNYASTQGVRLNGKLIAAQGGRG